MKFYGIRNKVTKEPLGFNSSSNGDDVEGVSVEFTFESSYTSNVWLVKYQERAIKALNGNTPWYNAGYESPRWESDFNPKNYEVFEVEI